MNIVALVMAAMSGVLMAMQGSLNTALGKIVGLLGGTVVVHIVGSIFGFMLLLIGLGEAKWTMLSKAPWYTYFGGILGVGIIYLVVASISKVGVAAATTAIIIGQVSMAALIDHFGWFGLQAIAFNVWKGLGLIFMAIGAWLLLHR